MADGPRTFLRERRSERKKNVRLRQFSDNPPHRPWAERFDYSEIHGRRTIIKLGRNRSADTIVPSTNGFRETS